MSSIFLVLCASTTRSASDPAGDISSADILELVYSGLGGRNNLDSLNSLSIESTRDRYVFTAGGPEPGYGVFKLVTSELTAIYDLAGERFRLDYIHKNLYQHKRHITELIDGRTGYIMGRDDYYSRYADPGNVLTAEAMLPSRWAMTRKTEVLLNPHFLLQRLIGDPSLVQENSAAPPSNGFRLTEKAVFPISLSFNEITGRRKLISDSQWLRRWQGSAFLDLLAEHIETDDEWYLRWRGTDAIDSRLHYQLVIQDEVHPITLHIHKETGHISQLVTMEHDWAFGDVELEIRYYDWQAFNGVYFPTGIKLFVAGTPGLDVTRANIIVNPNVGEAEFMAPAGITYTHDEFAADRGARASHWVQAQAHGGSPRKPLGRMDISAHETATGVFELLAIPDDDFRTLVVEQDNGVVVVDPGFEDLKGEAVIGWVNRKFPGKPISHIVITHHHVDHSGGFRPYVAAGATLVAHELAKEYFRMQIQRRSRVLPDALDRNPDAQRRIITVPGNGSYTLEDSSRPVSLYPVLTGHSADMLMVFVGNEGIIYNGDLYSREHMPKEDAPQSCFDLDNAITRHDLDVTTMSSSHSAPVSYRTFKEYLTR